MTFTSIPENYSPAFAEAKFAFEPDEGDADAVEFTVWDARSGETIGAKRMFASQGRTVNIAGYIGRRFEMEPLTAAGGGLKEAPGRTVKAAVEAEGEVSPEVSFTASCVKGPARGMMSTVRRTVIGPGECDEIPVLVPGESLAAKVILRGQQERTLVMEPLEVEDEAAVAVISMPEIAARLEELYGEELADYHEMRVELRGDGTLAAARNYVLNHNAGEGVRLCWVNGLGGLDFFTFPCVESQTVAASKQRIFTPEGYRVVTSRRESILIVSSGYQPEERLEWLAGVVCSPKVWRVGADGSAEAVDVVTDSAVERSRNMSSITLALRKARAEAVQMFS